MNENFGCVVKVVCSLNNLNYQLQRSKREYLLETSSPLCNKNTDLWSTQCPRRRIWTHTTTWRLPHPNCLQPEGPSKWSSGRRTHSHPRRSYSSSLRAAHCRRTSSGGPHPSSLRRHLSFPPWAWVRLLPDCLPLRPLPPFTVPPPLRPTGSSSTLTNRPSSGTNSSR